MADNVKTEETTKMETEFKDARLEAFLAELKKENPDLSVIKAGIEKYGTGNLSDAQKEKFLLQAVQAEIGKNSPDTDIVKAGMKKFLGNNLTDEEKLQKEQFLKAVFPEEVNTESFGFRKMTSVSNALKACSEMLEEGELTKEQVKDFLLTCNPHGGGKNIVTTVAINIYASDFKLKYIDKNSSARVALEQNRADAEKALEFLLKVDNGVLKDVINTPDSSERKLSLSGLAKSGKSESLSDFMSKLSEKDEITVDAQNTTVIGGNDGLNVDGPAKKGLTVQAPQNDDEDDKKQGDLLSQEGDDNRKKKPFDWEKVKEQDIIQYMFENWFLGGLNAAMKAPFWLADKLLDGLSTKFDTHVPKGTKSAETEQFKKAINLLNDGGSDIASGCMGCIERQKDYYNALHDTIKNNVGKDPSKWASKSFNGKLVLDPADEHDCERIKQINKLAEKNKIEFLKNLDNLKDISDEDFKTVNRYMQIGARLAVSQYMAANPNGPFDNEAQGRLIKMAMNNTDSVMQTIQLINNRIEYNYRIENGIAPETPLNDVQKTEVTKAAEPVMEKFVEDLTGRGAELRNAVYNYHKKGLEADKEPKAADMQARLKDVNSILSITSGYIDSICPSKLKTESKEKISMYDLGSMEVHSGKLENLYTDKLNSTAAELDLARQMIEARRKAYKENPAYRRLTYAASRAAGKTERVVGEGVELTKEVGGAVVQGAQKGAKKFVDGTGSILRNMKNSLFGGKI